LNKQLFYITAWKPVIIKSEAFSFAPDLVQCLERVVSRPVWAQWWRDMFLLWPWIESRTCTPSSFTSQTDLRGWTIARHVHEIFHGSFCMMYSEAQFILDLV
jgi:hypothetical protein